MPAILDPCCGSRMMWLDRQNPNVVFGDIRSETITVTDRSHGKTDGTRTLVIEPDVLMDFRDIPFPDGSFRLTRPIWCAQASAAGWPRSTASLAATGKMTSAAASASAFAFWSLAAFWFSSGTKPK